MELFYFLLGVFLLQTVNAEDVVAPRRTKREVLCFERLGCFSNDPPYNNTQTMPLNPAYIQTTFYLLTTFRRRIPEILIDGDVQKLNSTKFRSRSKTVVIVHGFLQNGRVDWMLRMGMELLKRRPLNVILVDWGRGSGFPYEQAVANTRVVGAQIASLITFLNDNTGTTNSMFHIIGHSLGAHIAGYAGERLHNIGRITGLDPAQPNFQNFDIQVRLDATDATFVDVIHTDGSDYDAISGYGMSIPVGHIDFYPNGGTNQPGCPRPSITGIITEEYYDGTDQTATMISCSHSRSIFLFTESINSPCQFEGFKCDTARDFFAGECFGCDVRGCPSLGYKSIKSKARGKFYLSTRPRDPFCGHQYLVKVTFGSHMEQIYGTLKLRFLTTDGLSEEIAFHGQARPFAPGQKRSAMLVTVEDVGTLLQAQLSFNEQSSMWYWRGSSGIVIQKVTITEAKTNKSWYFCGRNDRMRSGDRTGLHNPQRSPICE